MLPNRAQKPTPTPLENVPSWSRSSPHPPRIEVPYHEPDSPPSGPGASDGSDKLRPSDDSIFRMRHARARAMSDDSEVSHYHDALTAPCDDDEYIEGRDGPPVVQFAREVQIIRVSPRQSYDRRLTAGGGEFDESDYDLVHVDAQDGTAAANGTIVMRTGHDLLTPPQARLLASAEDLFTSREYEAGRAESKKKQISKKVKNFKNIFKRVTGIENKKDGR